LLRICADHKFAVPFVNLKILPRRNVAGTNAELRAAAHDDVRAPQILRRRPFAKSRAAPKRFRTVAGVQAKQAKSLHFLAFKTKTKGRRKVGDLDTTIYL
jgi:hypothetical protein